MKILIFMTQFYQLGGAERLAVDLAEQLNNRGIHADILSLYTEDLPNVAEAKEALLRAGIPNVHFLGMRIHPPTASAVRAILKLRRLILEQGYDVVETSMTSPAIMASWATRGTRARHLAGLHQVFKRDREASKRHRLWRFSALCNRHIRYYAISDYAAEHWIRYSLTSPRHTRRIYNAITDDFFAAIPDSRGVRKELGLPEEVRLAVYVGRIAAYKGIDTLLDALGPILEQEDLVLLYIGLPDFDVNGTREMLQKMAGRIARENWAGRVKFLGFRKDIPRLMASAHVLAHPTRIEGFGLTLVEAMAAGLPVVASNVEAIPEVLAGTDCIMVPPDDPAALRDAVLTTLSRSYEEVTRAVEKGKKRADGFRMDRRIVAMISLFQNLTGGFV